MIKLRIQINPKTSLKEAIDIMQNEELFTLPVVENGKIIGVITEETVFEYMLANE
jgi:predicted transcriptional regulator